jgi:hypothetical protein
MCLAIPWNQVLYLTGPHHKMAAPNQGPAPVLNQGPAPVPNQGPAHVPNPEINPAPDLPTRDIDLSDSTWASDGQSQQPQTADLTSYLAQLTAKFASRPHYTATLGKSLTPLSHNVRVLTLKPYRLHSQLHRRTSSGIHPRSSCSLSWICWFLCPRTSRWQKLQISDRLCRTRLPYHEQWSRQLRLSFVLKKEFEDKDV